MLILRKLKIHRQDDIPSNLVRVANDGQKAFTHACSALQKISYMTDQMSSVDGLVSLLHVEVFAVNSF